MIRHATVGTQNIAAAKQFYDAVLAPLNLVARYDADYAVGYGKPDAPNHQCVFWSMLPINGDAASFGNGTSIAFWANSQAQVDAVYRAAIEQGAKCEGAPGPRKDYHPDIYVAYFRDPDQNKLAVIFDANHPPVTAS